MRTKRNSSFLVEPHLVCLPMTSTDKKGAICELLDVLTRARLLADREAAEQVIFERETSMSTGMEAGIAIPHGKTDTVDSLLVAVGIHPAGIDFDAADGGLSHIFVLTLSPASKSGPHIRFLAQVSRLMRDPEIRDKLLKATSGQDVAQILTPK